MKKRNLLIAEAVGAIVVVAVLFFVLRGDDEDGAPPASTPPANKTADNGNAPEPDEKPEPTPAIPTVRIKGAEPVGGPLELEVKSGDQVRFRVVSDVADEVHLHGYDISKPVQAGGAVTFSFPADIQGVYEVELEERAVPIAELSITP